MKRIIAGYRVMLGFTQAELAEKLHISRQSYYMKESGKVPFTDKEKIVIKELVSRIKPDVTIDSLFF